MCHLGSLMYLFCCAPPPGLTCPSKRRTTIKTIRAQTNTSSTERYKINRQPALSSRRSTPDCHQTQPETSFAPLFWMPLNKADLSCQKRGPQKSIIKAPRKEGKKRKEREGRKGKKTSPVVSVERPSRAQYVAPIQSSRATRAFNVHTPML